jgi:hypothetical protein
MNTYVSGSLVRVSGAFTGNNGAVLDPTVVKVAVLEPGAIVPTVKTYGTDAEVVKDGTGQYHLDIDANTSGVWRYRWFSTGNGQAANESAFEVAVSPF